MEAKDNSYYTRIAIASAVILAVFAIIFIFSNLQKNDTKETPIPTYTQAAIDAEESDVKVIQAALDVHYLKHFSSYPMDIEDMLEDEDPGLSSRSSVNRLKDFDYKVKGNRSAYRITYKSLTGETKTVDGSYQEDYH